MPKQSSRSRRPARATRSSRTPSKKVSRSAKSQVSHPPSHSRSFQKTQQSSVFGSLLLILFFLLVGGLVWYAFLGGREWVKTFLPVAQNQALVGRFRGDLPAADTLGRTITLETKEDGTAVFTQDYHDNQSLITETGRWEPGDESTLVVRLDKRDGEPLTTSVPMIFTFHTRGADALELVRFDPRDWGTNGLQLQRLDPFLDSTWVWKETVLSTGQRFMTDDAQSFSLEFTDDGRVSVKTDCNNGGGSYQLVGLDGLAFGALFSTRMYCAGSQETEFFRQVEQAESSLLEGRRLQLMLQDDTGTMVFESRPLK